LKVAIFILQVRLKNLRDANFFIVAVPTPVDSHNVPDLKPVQSASRTIGQVLKKGDYVVYESTVYPGCTEEDCLPILEELSGLKMGIDFKLRLFTRANQSGRQRTYDYQNQKLFLVVMQNHWI
jgi:UDP-N-acetyl-D-mannosaminuronate dehydrogenase